MTSLPLKDYKILFFRFNPLLTTNPFCFFSSSLSTSLFSSLSFFPPFLCTNPSSSHFCQMDFPLLFHLSFLSDSCSGVGIHLLFNILLNASGEILNMGAYSSTVIPGFSCFNCFNVATAAGESLLNGFHLSFLSFALTFSMWIFHNGVSLS